MPIKSYLLTGELIRAARALGRIDQLALARRSGLSLETIRRLERVRGRVDAHIRTLNDIVNAFSAMGIEFEVAPDGGLGMWVRQPPSEAGATALRGPSAVPAVRTHSLHRLVYSSTARVTGDEQLRLMVADLAPAGAKRNLARDVTSALLACDGQFVQAIEGSKDAVLELYGLITTDRRHTGLSVLESSDVYQRQFEGRPFCWRHLSAADLAHGDAADLRGLRPELLSPVAAVDLLKTWVRDCPSPSHGVSDAGRSGARAGAAGTRPVDRRRLAEGGLLKGCG